MLFNYKILQALSASIGSYMLHILMTERVSFEFASAYKSNIQEIKSHKVEAHSVFTQRDLLVISKRTPGILFPPKYTPRL